MRLFGIGIKSVGIFFLAFLPGGAFVEQDQESFERASVFQKVRVCCGGSFGNFLMFLFLTLVLYLAWATPPVFVEGIRIRNVTLHSPAHQAGLREGMLIQEVDGMSLKGYLTNWTFEFELRPGDRVLLRVGNESYEVIAGEHPENETMGYLGIVYAPEIRVDLLYQHVVWLTTIQYWIAILNVLPIYPLDGGVILKAIAAKKFGRNWRKVVYPITCFFVALLLFIFIGPYFVAP
jgi:membrane-associated protease RseP (regulator of RpoE activity)